MKICEYIINITDIKYVLILILNEWSPKRIALGKEISDYHNIYFLLRVDPMYDFYIIYTTLKVRLRNIKHPYLELSDTQKYPYVWEAKTSSIDILREIQLMFR